MNDSEPNQIKNLGSLPTVALQKHTIFFPWCKISPRSLSLASARFYLMDKIIKLDISNLIFYLMRFPAELRSK